MAEFSVTADPAPGGNSRLLYWALAIAAVLAYLAVFKLAPECAGNEGGKLVMGRRLLDSSFLATDPAVAGDAWGFHLSLLYSSIVGALWVLLGKGLAVAMVGRVLVWLFVLVALARLIRTLGLSPLATALALLAWLVVGQSAGADEWIFGSLEGKCFAYGCLFLSMEALLRGRPVAGGFFAALATWFHVLVGGWGSMVLVAVMLWRRRDFAWRTVVHFSATAAVLASPQLAIAVSYALGGAAPGASNLDVNGIVVFFRTPHHMDPAMFLKLSNAVLIVVQAMAVLVLIGRAVSARDARFLRSVLAFVLLLFGAGLVARWAGVVWFLKYYPFRLADVLVPLLFWLTTFGYLVRVVATGPIRFPIALFRNWRLLRSRWPAAALLVTLAVGLYQVHEVYWIRRWELSTVHRQWRQFLAGEKRPYAGMTGWIQGNTSKTALFLIPPCEYTFWIEAERPEVVDFKHSPHNAKVIDWYQRIKALNGGREFKERGFDACRELRRNYPRLTIPQLRTIRQDYGADYYLTDTERQDLAGYLVHANKQYFLYELRPLAEAQGSAP